MNDNLLIKLLKAEVLPIMGCMELSAVALAAAQASEVLEEKITQIEVSVSADIYINGMEVGIPGTGETGLEIAAALGAIKKHPENQLSVLREVTGDELLRSRVMLGNEIVRVTVDEAKDNLWIQVRVTAGLDWSQVVIMDKYTNIVSVQRNGVYLSNREQINNQETVDVRAVLSGVHVTIDEMIKTIETIPEEELDFLLEGIDMNLHAAQLGIAKGLGMGIGAGFEKMMHSGVLSDDMVNYAKRLTAAAADARMSGEDIAIMSSAGSGNHGITAIMPVYAVAQRINSPKKRLVRALAISHLITIYIKIHTGNSSALCGCAIAAATGASAAITWLMGGDTKTIEAAIKNIIGNLTGMICDGGKVGCALKLSTAAGTAVESSLLAQRNIIVPNSNGIIAATVEDTIKNLGKISNPGILQTDKVIMEIMLEKGRQKIIS